MIEQGQLAITKEIGKMVPLKPRELEDEGNHRQ